MVAGATSPLGGRVSRSRVTGVAGPTGGTAEKPVGLVHIAARRRAGRVIHREMRYGDLGRSGIRLATVRTALEMLLELAQAE